ncbi:MAG: site-2 protease family protein [Candidatus Odinarchaeia archaeon]
MGGFELPPEVIRAIDEQVRALFKVQVSFTANHSLGANLSTYLVEKRSQNKEAFALLFNFLSNYDLIPTLKEESFEQSLRGYRETKLILRITPAPPEKKRNIYVNYALLLITISTVAITGYYLSTGGPFLDVFPDHNSILVALGFTVALMCAVGLHELAHLISLRRRGLKSSLPYFIPGIPILGLPTFGAIILQKNPPVNRDSLFDLGISGPMMSFIISFIVLAIGIMFSRVLTPEEAELLLEKYSDLGTIPVPLLFMIFQNIFFASANGVLFMHPIAYAGWLGLLITSLNLFPIGQLDGGHAMRALVNETTAKYISYIALIILAVLGYWLMAILVFLISGFKNQGALDDASPITKSRKFIWVVAMILLVLSVTPLWSIYGW